MPQVHARLYHFGMKNQAIYVLDAPQRFAPDIGSLHTNPIARREWRAHK
jgi:hypothetical protein